MFWSCPERGFLETQEGTSYRPTTQVHPPMSSIKIFNKRIILVKCVEKSLGTKSSDPDGLGSIFTRYLRTESLFLRIRSSAIFLPSKFRQIVYKSCHLHHTFQYVIESFYFYFCHSYSSKTTVYYTALA